MYYFTSPSQPLSVYLLPNWILNVLFAFRFARPASARPVFSKRMVSGGNPVKDRELCHEVLTKFPTVLHEFTTLSGLEKKSNIIQGQRLWKELMVSGQCSGTFRPQFHLSSGESHQGLVHPQKPSPMIYSQYSVLQLILFLLVMLGIVLQNSQYVRPVSEFCSKLREKHVLKSSLIFGWHSSELSLDLIPREHKGDLWLLFQ